MPRKPTPHELQEWRESNRFTHVKKEFSQEDYGSPIDALTGQTPAAVPPPLATPLPKRQVPLAPLKPLSGREAARSLKPRGETEATLDLHGRTKLEAYSLVAHFVHTQHARGRRHILIITGKGRTGEGILRAALPQWLNEPALRSHVSAMAYAAPEKGGNGVMHVLLKKKP